MQQVVDYIIANWQWLTPIIVSVVEFFILLLFRTKKVCRNIYNDPFLYDKIIKCINEAEIKFGAGHGKEKLDYVISSFQYFPFDMIRELVEKVLSTPQKKGGK